MRSTKGRSRNKNNRNKSLGNVINRNFESSGPEGKVRGTPQQIIDKYSQAARDAQLNNDNVAAENFLQHAEHYVRMLAEAQREQDTRREQQERENRERQQERDRERNEAQNSAPAEQPSIPQGQSGIDVVDTSADEASSEQSSLVDTPEQVTAPAPAEVKKAPKPRRPRKPRVKQEDASEDSDAPSAHVDTNTDAA